MGHRGRDDAGLGSMHILGQGGYSHTVVRITISKCARSVSNGRAGVRLCHLACPGRAHDHLGGVITLVIVGINFVQTHGLILECTNTRVQITTR